MYCALEGCPPDDASDNDDIFINVATGRQSVRILDLGTWDALALDRLGDDGQRLVAGLTQHFTQLLHAVAVHDDGLPAGGSRGGKTLNAVLLLCGGKFRASPVVIPVE